MPHECTACGRTFPDGSKEMLSGCPDCGGTKFRFQPRAGSDEPRGDTDPPGGSGEGSGDDPTVTGRAWPTHGDEPSDERRVRGEVGSRARTRTPPTGGVSSTGDGPTAGEASTGSADDEMIVADEEPVPDREDAAQADARSGVAAPDEVPPDAAPADPDEDPPDAGSPSADSDDSSDLSALREELNDQFESIRIVSPGQYELNLMELYEREEHIISLREDGRYVIEVPESWRDSE
jgi:predicted  nucleic acid-binding Zn-ribbon protein